MDPIFDHQQLNRQRARARNSFAQHDFLFREAAMRLSERLGDMQRQFGEIACVGTHIPLVKEALRYDHALQIAHEVALEGDIIKASSQMADTVLSSMALHWCNDVPGVLIQLQRMLKPDGLLLANMLGGETLVELRQVLAEVDASRGGMAARIMPTVEVKALGGLLQRAGFEMPITDSETITVQYPDALTLMLELRGMGEGNALSKRNRKGHSKVWLDDVQQMYQRRFDDGEGGVVATFELVGLTGLKAI